MREPILAALLAAALLTGCGGADETTRAATTAKPSPGAPEKTATIDIVDFVYVPTPATVRAGEKVSIPNADAAPHTVTDAAGGKAFDSGTIEGNATGSVTIATPGTYRYVCEFHPFMKGQITVTK